MIKMIIVVIAIIILLDVAIMAIIHLFNGSRIPKSFSEFILFMNPVTMFRLSNCKDGTPISTPEGEREYMVTYRKTKGKMGNVYSKTLSADNIINATTLFCGLYSVDIHDVVEVMLTDEH
jgi:hypothetical protein